MEEHRTLASGLTEAEEEVGTHTKRSQHDLHEVHDGAREVGYGADLSMERDALEKPWGTWLWSKLTGLDKGRLKVLAVSSGKSALAWYLAKEGFEVIVSATSASYLPSCREMNRRFNTKVSLRAMDLLQLDVPSGSLDVYLVDSLVEWSRLGFDVILEAARVLRPGGLFIGILESDSENQVNACTLQIGRFLIHEFKKLLVRTPWFVLDTWTDGSDSGNSPKGVCGGRWGTSEAEHGGFLSILRRNRTSLSYKNRCWCGSYLMQSVHPFYGHCLTCGTLVQMYPPSNTELRDFYTLGGYWRDHVVRVSGYPSIEERAKRDFLDRIPVWYSLIERFKPDARSLLEIGCAHGGFLHHCHARGIEDVVGVEVDPATCELAKEKFGLLHVISGLFPDVSLPKNKFDVVTAFDVIEHFTDPLRALRAVACLLHDDGVFIFQTPCYRGEGPEWPNFRPAEHMYLFDEFSVRRVLDAAALEPLEIMPGLFEHDMFVVAKKWSQARRIFFIRTDAIGDNVLASAMLPHIKKRFPQANLIAVCQEHVADLYEACPEVDYVIRFDRHRAYSEESYRHELLLEMRNKRADIALCSVYSRDPLTDFLALHCGARKTIALRGDTSNISADLLSRTNLFYDVLLPSEGIRRPELLRHADFLRGIGVEPGELGPMIWLRPEDEAFADELIDREGIDPGRLLVFFPGAQSPARIYPFYVDAFREICGEENYTVVAVGSEKDSELAENILRKLSSHAINLCGRTNLRQTAALLRRARLGIGAETGSAHMACAVGTRNVVILGGGHYGRFMPYSALTTAVCLPLECYGCNWRCVYPKVHCVHDIAPEVVAAAVRRALSRSNSKPRVVTQGQSLWPTGDGRPLWELAMLEGEHLDLEIEVFEKSCSGALESLEEEEKPEGVLACRDHSAVKRALALNAKGERLYQLGDRMGAAVAFERAISAYPGLSVAYNNLAVLAWEKGDSLSAMRFIRSAAQHPPLERATVLNAVDVLGALGRNYEAYILCDKYLEEQPDDRSVICARDALAAGGRESGIRVSVIVSTYNAERFMRGWLEDLVGQTISDEIEIIVVDSGSTQNEAAIVREFQSRFRNIRYMRTRREGLYAAWNRAVRIARGRYLTNANTDDRHTRYALEGMAAALDANPDVALVYADAAVTNDDDLEHGSIVGYYFQPDFDRDLLFRCSYIGSHPMWRRELHKRYGEFDPTFVVAGDYDFWLRLAAAGERFLHISEVLGLWRMHPECVSLRDPSLAARESERARKCHWRDEWGACPTPRRGFFLPLRYEHSHTQ